MTKHLRTESPNFVWNGIYDNWSLAVGAANMLGDDGGLKGRRWLSRITQQLSDYRSEFIKYGIAMPPRSCNLPIVCATVKPQTILDFGGSSGWCWDYLKNTVVCNEINRYTVVETDDVVNHMIASQLHFDPVEYTTIDGNIGRCDLLYCNSVLQYFDSNMPLISLIKKTAPSYILLEEVVGKGDDDFFTVQNYYQSGMPYRFIGISRLMKELFAEGYSELVSYPYASPVLGLIGPFEMSNFPKNCKFIMQSALY